ncbi:MAG: TrkH family potassium uptake protein [Oscillospiraceae bacterium]|jgi:trk system potassium uptake protein TrkH|nr:TrkH family potassium uptake protein [Oscillospiraceae bacterium]
MNTNFIARKLGVLLLILAIGMTAPLAVSIIHRDGDADAFIKSIVIIAAFAFATLPFKQKSGNVYARDGAALTGLGWMAVVLLGALPYQFSGRFVSFADCFFESASGFTTTGATIIENVELMPHGIIFWRSMTHWMGGMGFLVLMLALMPSTRANGLHILRSESSGPGIEKFVPKVRSLARILYLIYITITVIIFVLLLLGGLNVFDALIHAFGAASTGGFSNRAASVGAFKSAYVEWVLIAGMLFSGINFALYYALLHGKVKTILKNTELRVFLIIVVVSAGLIVLNIAASGMLDSVGNGIRSSLFSVVSIITTTGYATADFALWPTASRLILLILMLLGACAVSTAGGLKIIRVIILWKAGRRETMKLIHPRTARPVSIDGKTVDDDVVTSTVVFFTVYIAALILTALIISFDGQSMTTTFSASLSALSNIGLALDKAGPTGSFAIFSARSKVTLAIAMLVGRLEVFPLLMLFTKQSWSRA